MFNICSICEPLTSSMLISKGPWDWHSGQEPGFTSWFWDWKKGPSTKLHLLQLYLTIPSWGRTPVQLLTTPLVRINWFRWSCLRKRCKTIYQQKDYGSLVFPIKYPKYRLTCLFYGALHFTVSLRTGVLGRHLKSYCDRMEVVFRLLYFLLRF